MVSVVLSLKMCGQQQKAMYRELLVYGESVVIPENEPDVADVPYMHVHGQAGPGLVL